MIPEGYDILVCAAFCAVMYRIALRSALTQYQFDEQADTILARIGYDKAVLRDLEV